MHQQALGRLQGPAAEKAKKIEKKLARLAVSTALVSGALYLTRGASVATLFGPDEATAGALPAGEFALMLAEEAKLADNARKTTELLLLLIALANVQIQKEKAESKDCGTSSTK